MPVRPSPLLQSKLGEQANLASLVSQILSVADGNKDGRVSLPEARSTWALLQMDEVYKQAVQRDNERQLGLVISGGEYVICKHRLTHNMTSALSLDRLLTCLSRIKIATNYLATRLTRSFCRTNC